MRIFLFLVAGGLSFLTFSGAVQAQQAGQAGTQPRPGDAGPRQQPAVGANGVQPGANAAANTGMEMEAVPEGWIRIATDTNGDGRYDRVEMIHVYDLEQARQNSARRARGEQTAGNAGAVQDGTIQAKGKIESLYDVELVGMEGEHKNHQLARIRTNQGHNIRADLGPKAGLSGLNVTEGQPITVKGTIGTINDRPILMAEQVTSGGKSVTVRLPEGPGHQRLHAQVLKTRTAKLKRVDGEQVIAHLRLLNGEEVEALLGPKDKLEPLKIQDGDSLDLLARLGRLNSEPVLVAEQVRHGDQLVSIDRSRRGGQGQNGEEFKTQDDSGGDKASPEQKNDDGSKR